MEIHLPVSKIMTNHILRLNFNNSLATADKIFTSNTLGLLLLLIKKRPWDDKQ